MTARRSSFAFIVLVLCPSAQSADERIDFEKQVAPIFAEHCIRCHSPGNKKGDISLATIADLNANEYVTAGDADGSYLIELVTETDGEPPAMPKDANPLTEGEVALLKRWVAQGAEWPNAVILKEKSKADASWWAYQPLKVGHASSLPSFIGKPKAIASAAHLPPKTDASGLPLNETDSQAGSLRHYSIDDFIGAKLAEHKLKPGPQADRRTLIRRLSFDLHGLPPTPEAVEAFIKDTDPKAYENLVDRMLESPHYGERYARHWLSTLR